MKAEYIQIKFTGDSKNHPHLTNTVEISVGGKVVNGIYKLEISAEPNDVFRCKIECYAKMNGQLVCLAEKIKLDEETDLVRIEQNPRRL